MNHGFTSSRIRPFLRRGGLIATALFTSSLSGVSGPAAVPADSGAGLQAPARAVAVTFDDLPATGLADAGRCDAAVLTRLTDRLVAAVQAEQIPVLGLVTESRVCDRLRERLLPELLTVWLNAGFELGNHTFSHPDLNRTPVAAFLEDIRRGETTTAELLRMRGKRLRFFRYPMLHTGPEAETRRAVEAFLTERGYVNAPVTIDNQEWIFAAVHSRALGRGDSATAQRVADAYVPFMETVFAFFERWSVDVLGYEPPQILLLHANELNADRFGELAAMMRRRGYDFVTVDEALQHPAYREPDGYVGRQGLSWIHRWAVAKDLPLLTEPREPAWLARLFTQ